MTREVVDFLNDLEARCAELEVEGASGLLLEVIAGGYRQIIGPFAKGDVTIFDAIERLKAEEDGESEPNEYRVALLHPVASTRILHPDYGPGPQSIDMYHGVPGNTRCVCGGIAHWHAVAPHGCDDCRCERFISAE